MENASSVGDVGLFCDALDELVAEERVVERFVLLSPLLFPERVVEKKELMATVVA